MAESNAERVERELRTTQVMIEMYCHGNHAAADGLCGDCERLLEYVRQRIAFCPRLEVKTTCADCPVHCYEPQMREQVRAAMRYAGPRMIFKHPIMALQHMRDSRM